MKRRDIYKADLHNTIPRIHTNANKQLFQHSLRMGSIRMSYVRRPGSPKYLLAKVFRVDEKAAAAAV